MPHSESAERADAGAYELSDGIRPSIAVLSHVARETDSICR
jgi:hypothetical protein